MAAGAVAAQIASTNPGATMRCVVVTGASTGIGWATVEALVRREVRVFAGVRREEDGARLAQAFGARVRPLTLDVTDPGQVGVAEALVRAELGEARLFGLVNNAGIALAGPLLHQPLDEVRRVFEVNLFGALRMVQVFAPLLGAEPGRTGPPGRIVQMSSVAGKFAVPFLGAYAGSKHALEAMSDSLRAELLLHGIDVVVIGPGSVVTPIWAKAEQLDYSGYAETGYAGPLTAFGRIMQWEGRNGLPAERVGEAVWEALTARRPAVRRALVPRWLSGWVLPRMLPRRWVEFGIGKRVGLLRRPA